MENDAVFRPMALHADCLRFGRHQHGWKMGCAILLVALALLIVMEHGPARAAVIYATFRDRSGSYLETSLAVIDTTTNVPVSQELIAAPGVPEQHLDVTKLAEHTAMAVRRDGSYYMRSSRRSLRFLGSYFGDYLVFGTPDGQVRILGGQAGGLFADATQVLPDAIVDSVSNSSAANNALTVGPSGDLIAMAPGEVWSVQPDGAYSLLATPSDLVTPLAAQYGPDLELYVLARINNSASRIFRFDGSDYVDVFPELPNLPFSNDFSIDAAGNFYSFDFQTKSISRIDPNGQISPHLRLQLFSDEHVRSFFVDEMGGVAYLSYFPAPQRSNHYLEFEGIDGTQAVYARYNLDGGPTDRIGFGHKVEFIPEPSSLVLAGCGAVSLGVLVIGRARRKRRG